MKSLFSQFDQNVSPFYPSLQKLDKKENEFFYEHIAATRIQKITQFQFCFERRRFHIKFFILVYFLVSNISKYPSLESRQWLI